VNNKRIGLFSSARNLLYEELTGKIINAALKVQNELGCGLLEKIYENALAWELELNNEKVSTQKEYKVFYREKEVGIYYADLIISDKVIIEIKTAEMIDNIHRAQILNYLKISGLRVGLIINFAKPKLEYERFII